MKYLATFSSFRLPISELNNKGKGSPYSIAELIPVLGSQPAGDVSHKPGGRLPLLSARPGQARSYPRSYPRRLLQILLLGEQRHYGCEQFAYILLPDSVAAAV